MSDGPDDLGRSTRTMALGTIASRGTGFLRTAVLASVLGVEGVAAAYNVANTTPNIVYELLLGGVLTSSSVFAARTSSGTTRTAERRTRSGCCR